MAHVVLFHSILGLRPAEHEIAAAFESDGHTVVLPDLYGGRSTNDYDEGFRLAEAVGQEAIRAHAGTSLAAAPEHAVLAGISFGASLIGTFWNERPRAAGALLLAGGTDWMEPRWPAFPVSAHIARPDPFDEEHVFTAWINDAGKVALEMHRYDGVGHYFLDRSLPDYDAAAAALCLERCRTFLGRL